MTRVIFLNRFFFPDQSATSRMLSTLAFSLAGSGKDIHIITSRQLYDDAKTQLAETETVRGVHVHRVVSTQFGRSKLLGRLFDYFSFCFYSWRTALAIASQGDILVAMTDPPLFSLIAMHVAHRRKAHLVNWLQDIYPEIAVQAGVPLVSATPVRQILSNLRDRSMRAAEANVVVGNRVAEMLAARGGGRLHVIPNWSDDDEIVPLGNMENPLRKEWGLADKFVVGYSGNLGRAHEFETLLAASRRFKDCKKVVFLFIGGGHRMQELARRVKQEGLSQIFQFQPYQDQTALRHSLSLPDVHWLSSPPAFEGLIVPSKFYGIAAAGKPVIAISAKDGELAQLIEQHQCGIVVEPGNVDVLEMVITSLSTDLERRAAMGNSAREMLDSHFSSRQAFMRWRDLLDSLESATPN